MVIRVGVMPAVGNGLAHMAAQGQLPRLLAHLAAYRGQAAYFSYQARAGEAPLWDPTLGDLVAPQESLQSPMRYALTLPFRQFGAYRKVDVVRATSLLGAIPAMIGRLAIGTPYVVTYGADYIRIAEIHRRSAAHLRKWRWLERAVMKTAYAVIVQNRAMAASLRMRYPKAEIRHIPNWVDTRLFRGDIRADEAAQRRVLYVGRLVEEKNLVMLAMGCKEAGAVLHCYGSGPLKGTLENLGAICPGAIEWTKLPDLFTRFGIFAMVSHTEGHCKALIEAMAAGKTCLVTHAVKEGMEPGINCLSTPNDSMSIAAGLKTLFSNGRFSYSLGARARITAEQLWDKKRILGREVGLLLEAAEFARATQWWPRKHR